MNNIYSRNLILCRIIQQIKERKKFLILISIFQFLSFPIIATTMQFLSYHPEYTDDSLGVFLLIPCMFFGIASLSGIILAISTFRYLHNKCRADADLSLPMTTNQRFIGDFFSGLIIYAVPYILSAAISLLILSLTPQSENSMPVFENYTIGSTILRGFIRIFINDFSEIVFMALSGLLIMIMLYTLTCFIVVCCGNLIECVSYTIIINVLIPFFAFICTALQKYSYIWNIYLPDKMGYWSVDALSSTSPFGGLIMLINTVKSSYNCQRIIPTPSYWTMKYVFVILIIFTLTFLLYKKRKAEDISKPFVFESVYYCFKSLITMSVFAYAFKLEMPLLSFLLSLGVFLILDVIKDRGIKKNRKIKTAVFYTALIAMSFLFIEAYEAYHINDIKKIPDRSDIRSVTLTLPMKYHFYNSCYTHYSTLATFSDTENIETTLDMHRKAIENKDKAYDLRIEIMYTMKNGVKKYRDIFVESSFYFEKSDEYVNNEKTPEVLAHTILSAFKRRYGKTMVVTEAPSHYYVPDELLDLSDEQLNELSESLINDIHRTAINDIPITETFCEINSCYCIPVEYTNTIDLFKKYGLIRE